MKDFNFYGIGKKFVIGMVHCLPLPGTAGFQDNVEVIIQQAVSDALTLEKAGVDAIMIENMGDGPFNATLDIEQSTALSAIAMKVKNTVSIPVGIDAAFNDYKTSLSIAKIIGAEFVRIPVFVDTVIFYNGIINPCARDAMIYRHKIHAENVKILADVQVKHTHMLVPTISIEESAKNAATCGADGIIVTGVSIGTETPMDIIDRVKKVVSIPVIVGSGANYINIKTQLEVADGAIIGSSLKEKGIISNPISFELTKQVLDALYKEE
jgi:hypothetical protein